MDIDKILFRASSIGKIMTDDRSGKTMGETAKSECLKIYRQIKHNRYFLFTNKYVEKGIQQEENAISLYSVYKQTFFRKNEKRLYNEFITGLPDIHEGKNILESEHGIDLKCSWELKTFPNPAKALDKDYFYQNHSYMALLPKARTWTTVYCLVNASVRQIQNQKMSFYYSMDCPGEGDEQFESYKQICIDIEKNMIFDMDQFLRDNPNYDLDCENWEYDIPMEDRVLEFKIERDEDKIQSIYSRVKECREYIKENFEKKKLITQ